MGFVMVAGLLVGFLAGWHVATRDMGTPTLTTKAMNTPLQEDIAFHNDLLQVESALMTGFVVMSTEQPDGSLLIDVAPEPKIVIPDQKEDDRAVELRSWNFKIESDTQHVRIKLQTKDIIPPPEIPDGWDDPPQGGEK